MRVMFLSLCLGLFISSELCSSESGSAGCMDWTLSGSTDVCCQKCKPGNHIVTFCGPDPSQLCRPCQPNNYIMNPTSLSCLKCTQCTDPQVEVQACTATMDTKCGCKRGFRCGNEQCSYCVNECGKGEEPTKQRNCRKCPQGQFNDQIHSACKPWRKSCPEGQKLVAEGDAISDIKCTKLQPSIPPQDETTWLLIVGGICAFCGVFSVSTCLLYSRTKVKAEKKEPNTNTGTYPQGELTIMTVEPEETCSYHTPEQELGSSMDSVSTQDSDCKLIV